MSAALFLGEHLISKGLLTRQELDISLMEKSVNPNELLSDIFIRFGFIGPEDLRKAWEEINPDALLREGQSLFEDPYPVEMQIKEQTVYIGCDGSSVYIATISPRPQDALRVFQDFVADEYEVKFANVETKVVYDKLEKLMKEEKQRKNTNSTVEDDGGVTRLIHQIIREALFRKASDIHFEGTQHSIHVRFRVLGVLTTVKVLPAMLTGPLFSRIKGLCNMDISERYQPQDGNYSLPWKGETKDFRVATLPLSGGYEKITVRILDKERVFHPIEDLGITDLHSWLDLSQIPNGIVIVCGPTGSGKTTTLYATVNRLDKHGKAVYTIEDPVEYRVPFISQCQVNNRINMDFAAYLRTLLRHDPDIVIVGELRDRESAENALHVAETGHLVYATLHTNDVISSIHRLKDLGADLAKLKYVLRGILVQQLVRVPCPTCKGIEGGKSCKICFGGGYNDRTLLTEFARFNDPEEIEALLSGKKTYRTFQEDIRNKLAAGATDGPEIIRVMGACQTGGWCIDCRSRHTCHHLNEGKQ